MEGESDQPSAGQKSGLRLGRQDRPDRTDFEIETRRCAPVHLERECTDVGEIGSGAGQHAERAEIDGEYALRIRRNAAGECHRDLRGVRAARVGSQPQKPRQVVEEERDRNRIRRRRVGEVRSSKARRVQCTAAVDAVPDHDSGPESASDLPVCERTAGGRHREDDGATAVEALTGGRVHLRILSNLADRRLARTRCTIPLNELAFNDFSSIQVRDGIIDAWAFAASDPYRAATHNKGIMNGVDAVVIATGNDWRAVEAGAHAYAVKVGRYTSLSTWGLDASGNLVGTLEMPMAVGIVGGATRVHPTARAALKLMGVETAAELAEIIVSVGLAQNSCSPARPGNGRGSSVGIWGYTPAR